MYEQMKNDFMLHLSESAFAPEQIGIICKALDKAAYNYDVKKKETALAVYNQDVPQLVKVYMVSKAVEGYSEGTLYNYRQTLTSFFRMAQKAPEHVTSNDIRVFLYKYKEERHISNNSLEKIRGALVSFFKWSHAEGYIHQNPMLAIKAIKVEKTQRNPLSQIELEYLRSACRTPREHALVELMYSTGCRIGELVILKKSDIDWTEKTIHLFGKGKKHRTSFLNAKAEVAVKEYLKTRKDDSPFLFIKERRPFTAMTEAGVRKILYDIVERTKNNISNKVTPHVIRHTTATRMLENNASISSIQMLLGHANISTTMIYAHNSIEKVQTEHQKAII